MKKYLLLLLSIIIFSCKPANDTQFTEQALNAPIITPTGNEILFKDIINKHQGKTIIIDVWAGWCGDCIKGLPKLESLQKKHANPSYVFISLDRNVRAWKNSIKRFSIKGDHYYAEGGWKSIFAKNINLDWIPRYIVINSEGKVVVYRAIEADDSDIINILENKIIK